MPVTNPVEVEGHKCELCGKDATHIYGDIYICCKCHQNGFRGDIVTE